MLLSLFFNQSSFPLLLDFECLYDYYFTVIYGGYLVFLLFWQGKAGLSHLLLVHLAHQAHVLPNQRVWQSCFLDLLSVGEIWTLSFYFYFVNKKTYILRFLKKINACQILTYQQSGKYNKIDIRTCTGDYKHMYEDIPPCKYQHTRTLVGCWSLLTGPAPGQPGRPACWGWTPSAASWRSAAASWRPAAAPRPPDSPASRVPRLLYMISTRCPKIPDQVIYLSKEYETEDNFIKFSVKNLICAIVMYALSSKAIDVATGIVALQKT